MATTQQLLDEAKASYHKLMTGLAARVVVDVDGSRVEFAVADAGKLANYIAKLEQQVASESGLNPFANIGPARFFF